MDIIYLPEAVQAVVALNTVTQINKPNLARLNQPTIKTEIQQFRQQIKPKERTNRFPQRR